jgi:hypothetical protein
MQQLSDAHVVTQSILSDKVLIYVYNILQILNLMNLFMEMENYTSRVHHACSKT